MSNRLTINATTTARELAALLGCDAYAITVGEEDYVYTLGTGETSALGGCAFAYEAWEVERFLLAWEDGTDGRKDDDQVRPYDAFCRDLDATDDRAVALAIAADGHRLIRGGVCLPVLTDDEFTAARDGEPVADPERWNAWRYPSDEEIDGGATDEDMVLVGSADDEHAAARLLPRGRDGLPRGQVQRGLDGDVINLG